MGSIESSPMRSTTPTLPLNFSPSPCAFWLSLSSICGAIFDSMLSARPAMRCASGVVSAPLPAARACNAAMSRACGAGSSGAMLASPPVLEPVTAGFAGRGDGTCGSTRFGRSRGPGCAAGIGSVRSPGCCVVPAAAGRVAGRVPGCVSGCVTGCVTRGAGCAGAPCACSVCTPSAPTVRISARSTRLRIAIPSAVRNVGGAATSYASRMCSCTPTAACWRCMRIMEPLASSCALMVTGTVISSSCTSTDESTSPGMPTGIVNSVRTPPSPTLTPISRSPRCTIAMPCRWPSGMRCTTANVPVPVALTAPGRNRFASRATSITRPSTKASVASMPM